MNMFKYIYRWSIDVGQAMRNEFKNIFGDIGVLLFYIALPILYPVIYTLVYNTEVVRDIPIAVVDDCRSTQSRDLVRKADATPEIDVFDYCANMADAKALMADGKVFGIMHIPSNYERDITNGTTAHVEFFSEMSLLLRYRAFVAALSDLQIEIINEQSAHRIDNLGAASFNDGAPILIQSESNFLGDTEQGFASFVIPGIVILILHQSMLLGISLMGGTENEQRKRLGIKPSFINAPVSATVIGKALASTFFYFPACIYVLHIIPLIFDLPHQGNPVDYFLFIFPMLLATAFLGQIIASFMKERESAFIVLVFSSVIFLFLSGLTWPRYAMSDLWIAIGNCIPAVWGVEGFIRINSNAASLDDVSTAYSALWILAAIYLIIACAVTKFIKLKYR